MNRSESHSLLADSTCSLSPQHRGKNDFLFLPKKLNGVGAGGGSWHTNFLLLALLHIIDEQVLFCHQEKHSPENFFFFCFCNPLHRRFSTRRQRGEEKEALRKRGEEGVQVAGPSTILTC